MKDFCVHDIFPACGVVGMGGGGQQDGGDDGFLLDDEEGDKGEVKGRRGSLRRERNALGKKARMKMLRNRNWYMGELVPMSPVQSCRPFFNPTSLTTLCTVPRLYDGIGKYLKQHISKREINRP